MNGYTTTRAKWFSVLCCIVLCAAVGDVIGEPVDITESTKTEARLKLEEKAKEAEKTSGIRAGVEISPEEIATLDFPKDTSAVMTAKQLRISGNVLITTEELLSNIPLVYNASNVPLQEAESVNLYDFRTLRDIIEYPGQSRQITARTIRGLTKCILSIYQDKGYAGIYVYVPSEALEDGKKLRNEILLINIIEASVTSIATNYYTPENEQVEEGYLKSSFLEEWSPIEIGQVGKQKDLDEFINLLNLNPDRYVSATVSRGIEPDSLSVGYNVYEANPWHWFLQIDNAGTKDRRWTPRVGLINTNLTGIDDKLTAFFQAPWEKNMEDEYSIYGSYDFPIMGPKLRLTLFGGRSEFDVDGGGGIDFLGNGSFFGGELRYNLFQKDGWFFDITSSLSRERSKVSSSIFSAVLGSKVRMDLWGVGVDLHRRRDMSNTSVSFDRVQSVGGSSQRSFWDAAALTGARNSADRDFRIYTVTANHSQYLDPNKVQQLSGSFRWVIPNERLVPAKMTTFGGMYSVRGYKESGIVADGGILASVQYEFDLVKHEQANDAGETASEEKPLIRRLAPLVFFDYGLAKIKHAVAGEDKNQDMYSVGPGALVELGENFSGAVYYGFPLEATSNTDTKDGRLNVSLMMRW